MIISDENGIFYELDQSNFTAQLINSKNGTSSVFVPKYIIHESQKYTITSIGKNAFEDNFLIKSVTFSQDSEVRTINKKAFIYSMIQSLTIPPKLEDFKGGWYQKSTSLTQITISKQNKNFSFLDDDHKILIGKSDQKSGDYDTILFACKDVKNVFIPKNIKHNCIYSANKYNCTNISSFEFSNDSQLLTISKCAFLNSSIENLTIPSTVEKLYDGWCNNFDRCINVSLSKGNKNYVYLDNEKKTIVGKSNLKEKDFDVLVYVKCDVQKKVFIPSNIKYIM